MKVIINIFLLVVLVSCNSQKNISGNYNFKTQCLGIELDGSQTLKVWGKGRNRFDAVEQAKKTAVNDVLFKGILDGAQQCEKRPLLPEVNARQNYESYFNLFFTDKGEYLKFVILKDERILNRIFRKKIRTGQEVTYSAITRVLRPQLQQKLITDGIIKTR